MYRNGSGKNCPGFGPDPDPIFTPDPDGSGSCPIPNLKYTFCTVFIILLKLNIEPIQNRLKNLGCQSNARDTGGDSLLLGR